MELMGLGWVEMEQQQQQRCFYTTYTTSLTTIFNGAKGREEGACVFELAEESSRPIYVQGRVQIQ